MRVPGSPRLTNTCSAASMMRSRYRARACALSAAWPRLFVAPPAPLFSLFTLMNIRSQRVNRHSYGGGSRRCQAAGRQRGAREGRLEGHVGLAVTVDVDAVDLAVAVAVDHLRHAAVRYVR